MSLIERRRHSRYETDRLTGSLAFHHRASLLNLSLAGLAVESGQPLNVRRQYQLHIRYDDATLASRGRVLWCRPTVSQDSRRRELPLYRAGLELSSALQDRARKVRSFVESTAVLPLDQRVFGRFDLAPAGDVDLNTEYPIDVKCISLCGLRVEATLAPSPGSFFELRVALPDATVGARARVIGSQPSPCLSLCEPRFQVGLELVELPSDAKALLGRFLRNRLDDPSPPLN